MFGYLKLPARSSCDLKKRYRQVYASLCSWQRQKFGVRASILISYEAVFLYHLAVDAGLIEPPADNTPTCCKLKNDWANHWRVNPAAAEFVSAFAILLARIKIEDDVRDSGNWLARGGSWFWSKAFRHSNGYFDDYDSLLIPKIEQLVEEHLALEQQRFSGSPEDYSTPTAKAFGLIFKSFASQLSDKSTATADRFYEIGQAIGAGILLSDCVFDYRRDLRRDEFNPIKNLNQLPAYRRAALKAFSRAGWAADRLVSDEHSPISGQILRHAFGRFDRFTPQTVEKPTSKFRAPRRVRQWSSMRTGDCDIPCDCGGCDGCDCGAGDGDLQPMCFRVVSPCHGCEACFCEPSQGKKSAKTELDSWNTIETLKPDSVMDAEIEGAIAVADCPLNPTGYILLDDQRYPAKTNGQFCDAGQQVRIVSKSTFGFIVELVED